MLGCGCEVCAERQQELVPSFRFLPRDEEEASGDEEALSTALSAATDDLEAVENALREASQLRQLLVDARTFISDPDVASCPVCDRTSLTPQPFCRDSPSEYPASSPTRSESLGCGSPLRKRG